MFCFLAFEIEFLPTIDVTYLNTLKVVTCAVERCTAISGFRVNFRFLALGPFAVINYLAFHALSLRSILDQCNWYV